MGDVLEVFIELVSVPVPIVNSSINVLVEFLLDIMRSSALELSTRDKASLVVNSICKWKPKLLGRSGLVPKIIEVIAWLIATSEGSAAGALFMQDRLYGEEAEEDEDAATHQTMAQSTLDELALRVPQMYVLDPIKGAILGGVGGGFGGAALGAMGGGAGASAGLVGSNAAYGALPGVRV